MRKRDIQIRTISFVHSGGELVPFDELTPEQRVTAATQLKTAYLNELFRGKAVFYSEEEKNHAELS